MTGLSSIADWAKAMGMSRQAGYQAVERCHIPVTDGQVDPLVATTLYKARTRRRVKREPAEVADQHAGNFGQHEHDGHDTTEPSERISYEEARRRREAAEAPLCP